MFFSYTINKKGRRPFLFIYKRKTPFLIRFELGFFIRFVLKMAPKKCNFTPLWNGQEFLRNFDRFGAWKTTIIFVVAPIRFVWKSCLFYAYFSPFFGGVFLTLIFDPKQWHPPYVKVSLFWFFVEEIWLEFTCLWGVSLFVFCVSFSCLSSVTFMSFVCHASVILVTF